MRLFYRKNEASGAVHAQMLLIIAAFAIMGVSSYLVIRGNEQKNLQKDVESVFSLTKTELASIFLEYETFLSGYSDSIRGIISRDEDENSVSAYMTLVTNLMLNDSESKDDLINSHGHFFRWGGTYISGINKDLPVDFNHLEQKCFKTAIEANGNITISEQYTTDTSKNTILTLSRYLTDYNNEPLGVICIDIEPSAIYQSTVNIGLTESSYGILLNEKLEVIAHPESYFTGMKLQNINSGLADLVPELESNLNIYERRVRNYTRENTIVYFQRAKYNWYLGIVIPVHEYYRTMNNMAVFLILIGSALASGLCFMMYQISQAKIRSDKRTQQKSNFLATMSHEIRTPLNAILGMTEIQMQNAAHTPSTSEAFIKINNSGNLLLSIINDILDLSKIEAGKLELVPVKYDVASLINDIVQLNYIRYESKPIEFNIEVDENIPSVLVGDELRIKQILNNLLSNAFKYTDQGHVTLSVKAECVGRGGAVLVTLIFQVKDSGQGMTPEQVSKLFDEYTRFNLEANRTTEGAGLGMTITKNLINLMYGKVSIKSAANEGTTVTVRLPQKTDGIGIRGIIGKKMSDNLRQYKQGNAINLKKSQISHEYMPYGRILIVDDVETNLYVAKGLMSPYGLTIDLATSGFEAIEKVKEGNVYDIIFMDHMMPKMDGIETTNLLREMKYTHPVVALTANALAGQAEVFLKSGFDGFISKPIDIRQLNLTLNRLIRDKQPASVVEEAQKKKAEMEKTLGSDYRNQQVDSQLAEIFARDAEKAVAVLESLLQGNFKTQSDIQLFVINVHAMKSALANIGQKGLSSSALRLEQAGREKNMNMILSETGMFIEELRKVINEIKPKDENNQTTEDSEDSIVFLREKLTIIKDACTTFDKKTVKNALNELREKAWSPKTKELLNTIAEHILHSEFDNTAALADEYLKNNS